MGTEGHKLTQQQIRNGYSNAFRGLCESDVNDGQFDSHPPLERRVDYLELMQPQIRQQMGCPPTVAGRTYCSGADAQAMPMGMPPSSVPAGEEKSVQ
jgi:hypothetical protein